MTVFYHTFPNSNKLQWLRGILVIFFQLKFHRTNHLLVLFTDHKFFKFKWKKKQFHQWCFIKKNLHVCIHQGESDHILWRTLVHTLMQFISRIIFVVLPKTFWINLSTKPWKTVHFAWPILCAWDWKQLQN